MKPQITERLSAIRKYLSEEEEAWGPESDFDSKVADDAMAGTSGAVNVSDVEDTFDTYVLSIVDSVLEEYDADEEDLVALVFDVAASCEEDGSLPPIPDEGDDAGVAAWVGKAKTMGFADLVFAAIDAEAEDEE